jgi:oligogalacturonide lyase
MGAAPWSRRAFLSTLPLFLNGETLPSNLKKFRDPATEFDSVRLTDPAYSSYLPPAHLRPVSQRNNSLLFTSNRSGSNQPFRLDVKTGEFHQIAKTAAIDPATLTHLPDERSACFFDGTSLCHATISNQRTKTLYEVPAGWQRATGFGLTEDGQQSVFVERSGDVSRIRLVGMMKGVATTVLESKESISNAMPRPKRAGIIYRQGEDIWIVNFDGQQNRKLKIAPGRLGPFLWSADGRTLLYLSYPEDRTKLHQLRESTPDTNEDKLVANTSQFVNFARNGDSSVFAGVSASKASPHILLLLRVTHRELTVCEHHASDSADVRVVFSPNSQRLFYQTDREGKPAIYSIVVDRFVEKTEF